MPFSTATSFKGLRLRVGKNEVADDFSRDLTLTLNLSVRKDEVLTSCAQSSIATALDFFTFADSLRYHKAADPKALSNS